MFHKANEIIKHAIETHEGGFVNHPADRGGATNMGITIKTLSDWRGAPQTVENVRQLTLDEAIEIYQKKYWDRARIGQLPPFLRYAVYDFAINAGPRRAVLTLQDLCGARRDGVAGPKTREALEEKIASDGPQKVLEEYLERRLAFFQKIIDRNPSQSVFKEGWFNRVHWFKENMNQLIDTKEEITEDDKNEATGVSCWFKQRREYND